MEKEHVILVDENDRPIGTMKKIEAHRTALLHRAFSVFIVNDDHQIMIQKRAEHKYHSPGLWANTCCSHQRKGENSIEAGKRRLMEEMGFTTELRETATFIYKAPFDNGLTEHEFDHILVGHYNEDPHINPEEVADWKWVDIDALRKDVSENPGKYTAWFKIIF